MDGWIIIKNVRIELNEAHEQAKRGKKKTALDCMKYASKLLNRYKKEAEAPDYGFKD